MTISKSGKSKSWATAALALAVTFGAGALVLDAEPAPGTAPAATQPATPDQVEFSETHVKPILQQQCYSCHGNGKKKGGLSLDSQEGLLKGGEDGAVVVPGSPESSMLIKAVKYTEKLKMPPPKKGKLTDNQIADLEKWVKDGAFWGK